MMYINLYYMGRLVHCLRAIRHDPPKCLEACLRFLTLLVVAPFPPSPWVSSGYPTRAFAKHPWAHSNRQIASPGSALGHKFESCHRQTFYRVVCSFWLCSKYAVIEYGTDLRTHNHSLTVPPLCCPCSTNLWTLVNDEIVPPTCCPTGRAGAAYALDHWIKPCHKRTFCHVMHLLCRRLFLCWCTQVLMTNLWNPMSYYYCSKAPSSLGGSGSNPQGDCPMQTVGVDGLASQHEEMAAGMTAASRWEEWGIKKLRALRM